MIPPHLLKDVGLSEHEAATYLALLAIGTGTVKEIAENAEIKRPTAYNSLANLNKNGLIATVPNEKHLIYTTNGPAALLSYAEEKRRRIKDLLPALEALHNQATDKPQIKFFEGKKGVGQFYSNEIMNHKELYFFASVQSFQQHPEIPVLSELPHYTKMNIKEIITENKEDLEYARICLSKSKTHKIKVVPKSSPYTFKTDNILIPGKVGITSLNKKLFAILIESQDVFDSYRTLFELAWASAVPVEKFLR